ncbi:MAG: hypothetical protein BZ136_07905 [Methanosphaera sp. rholeuAM74]|nr:MAG: hypothetical protein BZ136_07905 [Methanosphaera sp. rholeuAM74]
MSVSLTGSDGIALVGVTLSGGALSLSNNNIITNCTFKNNTCDKGSAIDNGIFSLEHITYNNNTVIMFLFEENRGNLSEMKSAIIKLEEEAAYP